MLSESVHARSTRLPCWGIHHDSDMQQCSVLASRIDLTIHDDLLLANRISMDGELTLKLLPTFSLRHSNPLRHRE